MQSIVLLGVEYSTCKNHCRVSGLLSDSDQQPWLAPLPHCNSRGLGAALLELTVADNISITSRIYILPLVSEGYEH
jgi:hypothetical protein